MRKNYVRGTADSTVVARPSHRQSELDASNLNPLNHRPQVSFKNGKEAPYASKGSVRPDGFVVGESLEVTNYNLSIPSNRSNLYNAIHRQYLQRLSNIPKGTLQRLLIDIRGSRCAQVDIDASQK